MRCLGILNLIGQVSTTTFVFGKLKTRGEPMKSVALLHSVAKKSTMTVERLVLAHGWRFCRTSLKWRSSSRNLTQQSSRGVIKITNGSKSFTLAFFLKNKGKQFVDGRKGINE